MPDLTIKEVCELLKISRQTFYNLDKQGAFPGKYRINEGWSIRIPLSDIESLKSPRVGEAG